MDKIIIKGARQHNLKNIDLEIPKNKLVVFTGVSGSGKSSLAMDTIYAEGQRRYVESLSSYARQFLGVMDKPDVDLIEGLSPAIAIDQKTITHNPRSTVGTVTEIYDFLRLLFARIGHQHCHSCGREISRQSTDQIVDGILKIVKEQKEFNSHAGVRFFILAPVVKDRKGEFNELFLNIKRQGYNYVRVDKDIRNLDEKLSLIKTNKHTIDVVVSRHILNKKRLEGEEGKNIRSNLYSSVESCLRIGGGSMILSIVKDKDFDFSLSPKEMEDFLFSEKFACPFCNISFSELEPRSFSFNSPHGACPSCLGLGTQLNVDVDLVLNKQLSIAEGGILPWSGFIENSGWVYKVIEAVAKEYNFSLTKPIKDLDKKIIDIILYGVEEEKRFKVGHYMAKYEGIVPNLLRRHKETKSDYVRGEIEKYMVKEPCKFCGGTRLKKEALSVTVAGRNIWEVCNFSVETLLLWVGNLEDGSLLNQNEKIIARPIIKEIESRLRFLLDVGLSYLTMARGASELSGGEGQRIRLASQIGSGLSGVLYVLDEPSIGLHQRDQKNLINTLKRLRDLGNTVLVVEHDAETMLESDYIFDFGPGAGDYGGRLVAYGTPLEIMNNENSLTGQYLSGKRSVFKGFLQLLGNEITHKQQDDVNIYTGDQRFLVIKGARGRNLKNIDVKIPIGKITCVTGVSGSGKSTLIMDTLLVALKHYFGLKVEKRPEPFDNILGLEFINKVIDIDQSPIGRTPKSNPATYTKTFDYIRELFAQTQEARIRGYTPGRFSFNVKGGRCESCQGEGQIKVEMQFMPDVYINCDVCRGKRYNSETLEITYKGKNISDVLNMTVEEAMKFFGNIPQVLRKLRTLYDVGLGYIKLGQPAPTLSGGEAQRIKLSAELSKKTYDNTIYILDEPTTGLHFADLEKLIAILKRLALKGATVVVIEHNLDVIASADYIIDLGLEGGDKGGYLIFNGETHELLKHDKSYTAQALRQHLKM